MAPSALPAGSELKILIVDKLHPEIPEEDFEAWKMRWTESPLNVRFTSIQIEKAFHTPLKRPSEFDEAYDRLAKIEAEQGPFQVVVFLAWSHQWLKPLSDRFLGCFPSLKFVAGPGAGYDHVDVAAFNSHKVHYSNCPTAPGPSTADGALLLILAVMRNTILGDRIVRRGGFLQDFTPGLDIENSVVGLVGLGLIGKIVARKLFALGVKRILYHTRTRLTSSEETAIALHGRLVASTADDDDNSETLQNATSAPELRYCETLDDILQQSDVLSLHVPLGETTHHLLGQREFSKCKRGIRIVNTARGAVIDEEALVQALRQGQVAGAALDVFEKEPAVHPYLLESDQVLLQPHSAAQVAGLWTRFTAEMLGNIDSYLENLLLQDPHQSNMPPRNAVTAFS